MAKTVTWNRQTLNVCVSAVGTSWIKVYESSDVDNDFTTLMFTNTTSGSEIKAYLTLTDSSASAGDGSGGFLYAWILYGIPISVGDTLSFSDETIHIDRGQILWVKSDTANGLSIYGKMIREVKSIT